MKWTILLIPPKDAHGRSIPLELDPVIMPASSAVPIEHQETPLTRGPQTLTVKSQKRWWSVSR